MTNNCKPTQNFDSKNLSCALGLFGLKSFHMGLLFSLNGRIKLIYCLLFYLVIKMKVKSFCEKPLQTSQTAVKTFKKKKKKKKKKIQNATRRTHQKNKILLYRILDEYT